MKKPLLLFISLLINLIVFGQTELSNVNMVVASDSVVHFYQNGIELRVRAYSGSPIYVADHYVSPTGSDSNDGSFASPWATWDYAFENTAAGELTYIRGGTYYQPVASIQAGVAVSSKNGSAGNLIQIFAYPGETPILDCSNATYAGLNNTYGIQLYDCDYWHLKGLTIRNVEQSKNVTPDVAYGVLFHTSNYITLEMINSYGHEGSGIIGNNVDEYLIKNCDSHDNGDLVSQQNGNGIAIIYSDENSNGAITGCRAWDLEYGDGFGVFRVNGDILIDSCWAWNISGGAGDGGAFEIGPNEVVAGGKVQTARNCIAVNTEVGFTSAADEATAIIHHIYNNTLHDVDYAFAYGLPDAAHIFRNNVSYANAYNGDFGASNVIDHNSWQNGISVTSGDFVSVDLTQLENARSTNGNLPVITLFNLVTGSDLKNAGVDVGTTYMGAAPDIGAFEFVE